MDDVKDALAKLNIAGMTVTEVRGHGKQKGHTAIYRGKEYNVSLLPKMEIEVVVPDALADEAIKAIVTAARTGEIGDGRVFVMPVLESYRILERASLRKAKPCAGGTRCPCPVSSDAVPLPGHYGAARGSRECRVAARRKMGAGRIGARSERSLRR